jgi:hypothetical protein
MNFYQRFGSIPMTDDYQYLLNQTSNLAPKLPSWFRRPARVTKHASRDSSPRSLVRRRTTASARAPSRHNSITDGRHHQKHYSTPSGLVSLEGGGRPMSWHSSGVGQADHQFLPSSSQSQSNVPSSYFLGPHFSTCEVNGAITPVTHPFAGEPFIQDTFTPLDDMSSQDFNHRYAFFNEISADTDAFYGSQCGTQYSIQTDSRYQFPNGLYEVHKQPEYHFCQLEETAPPTPEILPLQASTALHGDGSSDRVDQAGTEDLIGMGLYDAPSPMPVSMSSLGGPWDIPIRSRPGKGLKLEETFQPTTTEDEESDAGQGGDDEEGEEEEEEEEEPASDQTHDLTMPRLGLEERSSYYEQSAFKGLDFEFDVNNEKNAVWCTDVTANHGWI